MTTLINAEDLVEKDILTLMGLNNLSDEEKTDILGKLVDTLNQKIIFRLVLDLTGSNREEFERLLSKKANPEEIALFLQNKVPNIDDIITEEVISFKKQMTDFVTNLKL